MICSQPDCIFKRCRLLYKPFLPADSVRCSCAGCFAAGTGFLLNFTIREHPPGLKVSRSRRNSDPQAPLAPAQHRLTDDGEVGKVPTAAAVDQQGKRPETQSSKGPLGAGGGLHSEDEDGYGARQVESDDVQCASRLALPLQGATAQIKVR